MSLYDPPFRDQKRKKPGCDYESIVRSRAGETDLEKIHKAVHEQMEMLKQDKKDIVSGAIVKMPQTFLKPFEYSSELLLRSDQHPTLRQYVAQPVTLSTYADPIFALYPYLRIINELFDEISLKKSSVANEIKAYVGVEPVSQTYNLGMTKTAAGAYIRSLDVPTNLMPGNFGCRVIDGVMPPQFISCF